MYIQTFHFELFDTLVAPFWRAWGIIFQPLDTLWPHLGHHFLPFRPGAQKIALGDLIVESIFELKIDHFLGVFLKVHLGGLARLLAPKGSQLASKWMPKWS